MVSERRHFSDETDTQCLLGREGTIDTHATQQDLLNFLFAQLQLARIERHLLLVDVGVVAPPLLHSLLVRKIILKTNLGTLPVKDEGCLRVRNTRFAAQERVGGSGTALAPYTRMYRHLQLLFDELSQTKSFLCLATRTRNYQTHSVCVCMLYQVENDLIHMVVVNRAKEYLVPVEVEFTKCSALLGCIHASLLSLMNVLQIKALIYQYVNSLV